VNPNPDSIIEYALRPTKCQCKNPPSGNTGVTVQKECTVRLGQSVQRDVSYGDA